MTERREHRYEVTFTASEALDGRPIITLALDQEGQTAAGQDHVFFLELDRAIDPAATSRIAAFLGQYIKGFGVMAHIPQVTQDPSEPDSENGTSVLRPDALEEAARRSEPEPNSEEEGQRTPPPQIDGVQEAKADKPEGQEADGGGLPRAE